MVVKLLLEVQNTLVEYLDAAAVHQLLVILFEQLLASFGQLRRYLHEHKLAVAINVERVILVEVQHRVGHGALTRTYFDYLELTQASVLHLIRDEVRHSVAVVWLEELRRCHPCVLRVQALHLLSEVVIAAQLMESNGLFEQSNLVLLTAKIATLRVIEAIKYEIAQHHLTTRFTRLVCG